MALIGENIPKQNFERVNEQLPAILLLELENQKSLQGFTEPLNVFSERLSNFNASEQLMINTMYDGTRNNEEYQGGAIARNMYFIDVYAAGSGENGENESAKILHRFLGMIRYTLSHTVYKTLGFAPGIIGGVEVESIQIASVERNTDAANTTMGRLTLAVRMVETQPLETGPLLAQALSQIRLDLTDKGYKYEIK